MRRFVSALIAVTVFIACQPATVELTEEQKAEIAAEVSALQANWNAAWEVVDVGGALSSYWTESPEQGWAGMGRASWGLDGMAQADAATRPYYNTVASNENTRRESRTFVLAPNIVYIMERGATITTDTAGVAGPETDYAYTYVWVLEEGGWKINFAHGSSPIIQTQ